MKLRNYGMKWTRSFLPRYLGAFPVSQGQTDGQGPLPSGHWLSKETRRWPGVRDVVAVRRPSTPGRPTEQVRAAGSAPSRGSGQQWKMDSGPGPGTSLPTPASPCSRQAFTHSQSHTHTHPVIQTDTNTRACTMKHTDTPGDTHRHNHM